MTFPSKACPAVVKILHQIDFTWWIYIVLKDAQEPELVQYKLDQHTVYNYNSNYVILFTIHFWYNKTTVWFLKSKFEINVGISMGNSSSNIGHVL